MPGFLLMNSLGVGSRGVVYESLVMSKSSTTGSEDSDTWLHFKLRKGTEAAG